jgi:HEAT repeat protein
MLDVQKVVRLSERQKMDLLQKVAEGQTSETEGEELCECLLSDRSASVRRMAIEGLWGIGDPRHIDTLFRAVLSDDDVEVRASAASVLGTYVYRGLDEEIVQEEFERVRTFLVRAVRDEKKPWLVRRMALEAVSFDPGDDVGDLIEWAYKHDDREVNLSAIFAMGRSQAERWTQKLVSELHSSDRERKLEAINAAGEGYLEDLTPYLRNMALGPDHEVQQAAIWALSHTGGPGALEILELCAESPDEEVKQTAQDAIGEYQTVFSGEGDEGDSDEGGGGN